ncbi:Pex12 amino terminal region-domain-containing protein [Polychytrium aggregatum]|uniref:Pex12 amino terminal region-domain-containing protein n=1 Tax=Polychytrium aggregatum TaxID=110093 RepID=UPI0022FE2F16|nr:Pex12 amino terminal region-domain-containing protein [Polychytrium aggregatum]KAI9205756.1 Pex12 amino terminal region-domain-containing protein [Polychytrium aggregatum]
MSQDPPEFWREGMAANATQSRPINTQRRHPTEGHPYPKTSASALRSLSSLWLGSLPAAAPLWIMRVAQLDADVLDSELIGTLKDNLMQVLAPWKSSWTDRLEPEINAVLESLIYGLAMSTFGSSYGEALENLKYRNELKHAAANEHLPIDARLSRLQIVLRGLLTIGGHWAWTRLTRYTTTQEWSQRDESDIRFRLWGWMQSCEVLFKAVSLVNFLAFLYGGRYRTVVDRLLGARLVYRQREMTRRVDFDTMNGQLIWQTLGDFLLFLVPFVNLQKLKNKLARALFREPAVQLPDHMCAICHSLNRTSSAIHTPFVTNCGHVYCYYCIKSSILSDSSYPCPRCGATVVSIKPQIVLGSGRDTTESSQ